ncbi:MAG: hypothetical protein FJ294_13230 [Planctomycetes bacterium]|nr:hypothetical protein [Planctomycetota bacterium]
MHVALVLALVCAPTAPRAFAPPLALQGPAPTPADGRPEVKALCEQLGGHASKRGKEDSEAISVIDKLVQEFAASGAKDRAAIVKQLDKCFMEKRQEDKDGVRENKLFLAAATALGEMKPECVPVYLKWIGEKSHKKDIPLQRLLILKLGKTKHETGRKPLIDLLNDENAKIQAAAAEALGEFADASQEVRKSTFEALLKLLMSTKGQVDSNVNDLIARERYDTIAAPTATALGRLSGQRDLSPEEYQRFWNKNKKEEWPKP